MNFDFRRAKVGFLKSIQRTLHEHMSPFSWQHSPRYFRDTCRDFCNETKRKKRKKTEEENFFPPCKSFRVIEVRLYYFVATFSRGVNFYRNDLCSFDGTKTRQSSEQRFRLRLDNGEQQLVRETETKRTVCYLLLNGGTIDMFLRNFHN